MSLNIPQLDAQQELVESALRSALADVGELPLYGMLRYFMGYEDESFTPVAQAAGKRIRPTLLLYLADAFGGGTSALELAVALELFHNFTLIHDDIEDNDVLRRGRATVWKVWGVSHGINAGDAQALLANTYLLRAAQTDPVHGAAAARLLNMRFMEVAEGQYLDFELADLPLTDERVTLEAYLEMTRKKTSVLLGAAAAAGGVAAGCDDATEAALFTYGERLGLAYQIADDMSSIWGAVAHTGKQACGDIVARKKTYPVLFARDHGAGERLHELYTCPGVLSAEQVREARDVISNTGAFDASRSLGERYAQDAKDAAAKLPLDKEQTAILVRLVDAFVQFAPPNTND
jgi:geranylgeranyl diphosphate synthase type I